MAKIINRDEQLKAGGDATPESLNNDELNLNILHQFRSYSYHHILLVANTTKTAQVAAESNDLSTFLHPSYEFKYEPITPPGHSSDEGQYMVLINGMTDAEFLIQSLEIETIIDPTARLSNPHSSFVEGTMEVVEPKGVRFMNLLKIACDNLKADPSSLTFILKTIFVGYSDEGSDGGTRGVVKQVIDTKPFQFLMMDLVGEFNSAGSTYTISFVGMINGGSRMPMFAKVQQANISGGTVGDACASLEKNLNDAAKKSYVELTAQLAETNKKNPTAGLNYTPKGRPTTYKINVSNDFANLPLDNVHPRNQGAGGVAQMGTPQNIDVDSAISDILYSSTKIVEIMNKNVYDGYKTIFKVESVIETTIDGCDVIFAVKPCRVPVIFKDNTKGEGEMLEPNISWRNVIEYDYVFTGHNIDVLEYDMKMAAGIAFFQTMGSTNNLPGGYHSGSGNVTFLGSGPGTILNSKDPVMRDLTIVPSSASIADPASRNKVEPAKTADFRTFMSRQAALESLNTKMRIAGSPYMLAAFNQNGMGPGVASARPLKETVPLIKVNVRMPTRDNEFVTGEKDYTEDFWYTGYFQIMSVKSTFRDGRFEQELDLISLLFEEMVVPTGSSPAPARAPDSPSAIQKATPRVAGPTVKADASKRVVPTPTVEQQKKHGVPPPTLSPEEVLNCQSIRKLKPYTVEMARKTKLSKSFTLYDMIAGTSNQAQHCKWNLEAMTDQILDNLCALAKRMEEVQVLLGHNISINSVYRCPKYNGSTAGSSGTSDHMYGAAMDFTCSQFGTPQAIQQRIKESGMDLKQCLTEHRRGSGTNGWVHLAFSLDPRQKPTGASAKFMHLEV